MNNLLIGIIINLKIGYFIYIITYNINITEKKLTFIYSYKLSSSASQTSGTILKMVCFDTLNRCMRLRKEYNTFKL
jgi:hypothetical protein